MSTKEGHSEIWGGYI